MRVRERSGPEQTPSSTSYHRPGIARNFSVESERALGTIEALGPGSYCLLVNLVDSISQSPRPTNAWALARGLGSHHD